MVPTSKASVSPGNILDMQIHGPNHRVRETPGVTSALYFNKSSTRVSNHQTRVFLKIVSTEGEVTENNAVISHSKHESHRKPTFSLCLSI